jgi:hypothetical protein
MSSPHSIPFPSVVSRSDRRLNARLAIDREVCLCWQDRQGSHILRARAKDISKFGMLVEADAPLSPGGVISVETKATTLGQGCVRHCTPSGSKYKIGVHIPDRMTSLLISMD